MKHGHKIRRDRKSVWPLVVPGALLLSVQFAAASGSQQGNVEPLNTGGSSHSGGGTASGGSAQLDWGIEELGTGGMGTGGRNSSGGSGGIVKVR